LQFAVCSLQFAVCSLQFAEIMLVSGALKNKLRRLF